MWASPAATAAAGAGRYTGFSRDIREHSDIGGGRTSAQRNGGHRTA